MMSTHRAPSIRRWILIIRISRFPLFVRYFSPIPPQPARGTGRGRVRRGIVVLQASFRWCRRVGAHMLASAGTTAPDPKSRRHTRAWRSLSVHFVRWHVEAVSGGPLEQKIQGSDEFAPCLQNREPIIKGLAYDIRVCSGAGATLHPIPAFRMTTADQETLECTEQYLYLACIAP